MDTKVSACPRWVCVSITQLVYTMRCFIQWFLKIQFGFLFLSKCKILGDLRLPGRKAASFLAVFWQRFADTFMQNLLVFPATLLGGSNKQTQLLALLATIQGYADFYGNTEGTYTHFRAETVTLFSESF